MAWHFHAAKLDGAGGETALAWNIPLTGAAVTNAVNGAGGIDGSINQQQMNLTNADGEPVLVPWSTAIYAELDGKIRGAGILSTVQADGPALSLSCVGWYGYLQGMPYTASNKFIGADPFDLCRHMWSHVQGFKRGNVGLKLDSLTTGGKRKVGAAGTGSDYDTGPYTLDWWDTSDLSKEFEDLATWTPFEWREVHAWSGEDIAHKMEFGYPKLGTRKNDLRFVIGENITSTLKLDWAGDQYADEVYYQGSGEGSKMIMGHATRTSDRLRRPYIASDKNVKDAKVANSLADQEVKRRIGDADFDEVTVIEHPNATPGSWDVGDEIFVQSRGDWHDDLGLWVRILSQTWNVDAGTITLKVQRAEKQ